MTAYNPTTNIGRQKYCIFVTRFTLNENMDYYDRYCVYESDILTDSRLTQDFNNLLTLTDC